MPYCQRLAVTILAAFVAACAAPAAESYKDLTLTTMADADVEPYDGPPRLVESAGDPKMDVFLMLDQGYAVIGESGFYGDAQNPGAVLDEARRVGAALVVVGSSYGPADADAPSYIRYGVEQYDRWALYFAPLPRQGLGILFDRMTPRQQKEVGTDRGLQVIAIRKGSPAARSEIVLGDVILTIAGHPVYDVPSFRQAVAAGHGKDAVIELMRDGKHVSVTVDLGAW
ncbi:MAG TPA: PDZ domain-containing protein [Alphaproteobacteria bacterium]|nr:PDZ domain-containing protein [Alphaproteobacteria bacterium]